MYLLIIFSPLLGSFLTGFFGKFLGRLGIQFIILFFMFLTVLLSFFLFFEIALSNHICIINLNTWFESNNLLVSWNFLFDNLTVIMLIVVTFISTLVHIYSMEYMLHDPHLSRFMSYLSLFTFFMLMLVTANNYVQMFLGWEGVGLSSYLLINFWHTRILANKAAMKAIILNRIGDFGLSLGIIFIFTVFYTFDFSIIFTLVPIFINDTFIFFSYEFNKLTIITVFLFIGAIGKSAQIGLHTWLPDAMEGPTPVSALIHAATMVTAGVFILLRSSPLLEYCNTGLLFITIIGSITTFMAASIGIVQNDLKKVIAYSTCSQLGYMIFSCGLSNYSVSLFHLMNHAFFKALLFLSAGSVIHAMSDEQDMRKMGGLLKLIPITYIMILIGSLSLMGFPFLTGFYSKDILLELTFGNYYFSSLFIYWLGTLSAFLTSYYSIRLIYLTFYNISNNHQNQIKNIHESSWIMLFPLLILNLGSIFIGFLSKDFFLGLGVTNWNYSFHQLSIHTSFFDSEFLNFQIKLFPVIASFFGTYYCLFIYSFYLNKLSNLIIYMQYFYIYKFFSKKWYFDSIYNNYIVYNIFYFGYYISFKILDRGFFEKVGPLGIVQYLNITSIKTSFLHSGLLYHYILIIFLGIVFFITWISQIYFFEFELIVIFFFLLIFNLNIKLLLIKKKNV